MYSVDEKDEVRELPDIPQSSPGAPIPLVLADEMTLVVSYYLNVPDPAWDGSTARMIDPESSAEPVGVITFPLYTALMFGPPNDEAFSGHPLAKRGLEPYGAYEVLNSSWIRTLERMNSVHPQHQPDSFWQRRHFILAFHDSTLECVGRKYLISRREGPLFNAIDYMKEQLRR